MSTKKTIKPGEDRINLGGIGPSPAGFGPHIPPPSEGKWTQLMFINRPDNWDKGTNNQQRCETCMHYINFRCRRHSPNGQEGWPAVYPTDYCGDHKMDKRTMAERA